MKKLLAFTLAETLIVIGIIGVVSALTLPNLNSSTGEKEKVAKVKKIYRDLNDAFGRAVAVYGPVEEWLLLDNNNEAQVTRFVNRITEFMKVSKRINNQTFILADGTEIFVWQMDEFLFNVDIDGPKKGRNSEGVDKFYFRVNNYKGFSIEPDDTGEYAIEHCFMDGYCTSWVLMHDNMDYLKADDNGKCSNGKQLSWTNTTCK